MKVSLSVSTVGHAAIIAWGVVSLAGANPYEATSQESLPIEIMTVEEFTQFTAGTRDGEAAAAPAAPAPVEEARPSETPTPDPKPSPQQSAAPAPTPTPTPPQPEPAPEPLRMAALPPDPEPAPAPRPEPAPSPAAAAEPEPAPAARPTNVPVPRVKPRPPAAANPQPPQTARAPEPPRPEPQRTPPQEPERQFSADQIAALLNKVPDAGGTFRTEIGETTASLGVPTGNQSSMSLSEIDALRRQIAQCWSPPAGILDAGQLLVRLGLELNVDGSLAAPPRLLNASYDPAFNVAAEAAMRAVNRCQPYSLPPEKYDLWRQIHVNFDPKEILGG